MKLPAMKFPHLVLLLGLVLAGGLAQARGVDGDAVLGGALGGAAGAAAGSAMGGRDMAVLGGALGAAAGVALSTRPARNDDGYRGRYDDRHDRGRHRGHDKHHHQYRGW